MTPKLQISAEDTIYNLLYKCIYIYFIYCLLRKKYDVGYKPRIRKIFHRKEIRRRRKFYQSIFRSITNLLLFCILFNVIVVVKKYRSNKQLNNSTLSLSLSLPLSHSLTLPSLTL